MKRFAAAVALGLCLTMLLACRDDGSRTVGPEGAGIRAQQDPALEGQINPLVASLFPDPDTAAAHQLFAATKSSLARGDTAEARQSAADLLQLAMVTDLEDPPGATGFSELIDLMAEFVGITPPNVDPALLDTDGDDGTVAFALDGQDNLILTDERFAGTFIEDEDLDEDLVIVIERLTENEQGQLEGGECLPLPGDIEQKEGCYQFDRVPEGAFQNPVEVGVCQVTPLEEDFQLHRFETADEGVVALANVAFPQLECADFTVVQSGDSPLPVRWARAAWAATGGAALEWLGPQPLHAVDAGFGGSTLDFSRIGWAKRLDVDIVEGDLQSAEPGSLVPIDPQVRVTHLPEDDHSHVLQGADVTFTVVGGGGTLTAAEVTTITDTSDSDGLVSVPWRLGADGTNLLQAAVPGDTVVFTASTTGNLLASCTPDLGGDQLFRGYYYPNYPAGTLDRVDMFFSADAAGSYEIVLTAREDTFGGAVIEDDTVTVSLSSDVDDIQRATFLFGGESVAADTVAFEMDQLSGPGTPFFAVSSEQSCPLVETTDTSPPLSSDRFGGRGVGVDVFGSGS